MTLSNRAAHLAVDLAIDAPPAKVALYGEPRALCPEPFTAIHVEPGQTQTWTTTYTMRTLN